MTTGQEITEALRTVLYEFIHENKSVPARDPLEVNSGRCRWFAAKVLDHLGHPQDVTRHDAFWVHTWIEHEGTHYDAEHTAGISDPHEFKIWDRLAADELEIATESTEALSADCFEP